MKRALLCCVALVIGLAGCDDMSKQRKQNAYRAPAGDPAPRPDGTVTLDDKAGPPPPLTLALLALGQSQYRAFCTPCHSELGDGQGMVVQRGFSAPPSYHIARLQAAPTTHFFDVITNGYGAMYSFAQRITPQDRWAIAAYIRALQRSQTASLADLSPAEQAALAANTGGPDAAKGATAAPWASTGLAP